MEGFWGLVREFSQGLSTTTEMMIGQEIDYFQTLKDRLEGYLDALRDHPDAENPAEIIGPEFARLCGNVDDLFTAFTGGRMFSSATVRVREYLQTAQLQDLGNGSSTRH